MGTGAFLSKSFVTWNVGVFGKEFEESRVMMKRRIFSELHSREWMRETMV
jgi:hypothetical protein